MTDGAKQKPEPGKSVVLYLRPAVIAALEDVAAAQSRSRSYIANQCLAERLGIIEQPQTGKWETE